MTVSLRLYCSWSWAGCEHGQATKLYLLVLLLQLADGQNDDCHQQESAQGMPIWCSMIMCPSAGGTLCQRLKPVKLEVSLDDISSERCARLTGFVSCVSTCDHITLDDITMCVRKTTQ